MEKETDNIVTQKTYIKITTIEIERMSEIYDLIKSIKGKDIIQLAMDFDDAHRKYGRPSYCFSPGTVFRYPTRICIFVPIDIDDIETSKLVESIGLLKYYITLI